MSPATPIAHLSVRANKFLRDVKTNICNVEEVKIREGNKSIVVRMKNGVVMEYDDDPQAREVKSMFYNLVEY